jgi:hypothetical protein
MLLRVRRGGISVRPKKCDTGVEGVKEGNRYARGESQRE